MHIQIRLLCLLAPFACSRPVGPAAEPTAAVAAARPAVATIDHAARLVRHLSGRFDSSAQSTADPDSYKPVQLDACVVEAPELGVHVLYIEQALIEQASAPYRQRLYVVAAGPAEGAVHSRVFELKDPKAWVGLCSVPPGERRFTAAQVEERQGCRVELTLVGEAYRGGTVGQGCVSRLAGASYASSEVTVSTQTIESWDRGFDADGRQVWGAARGPYRFERRTTGGS